MSTLFKMLVWWALWISGCRLFVDTLMLTGPWLMAGGAITLLVCDAVASGPPRLIQPSTHPPIHPPSPKGKPHEL